MEFQLAARAGRLPGYRPIDGPWDHEVRPSDLAGRLAALDAALEGNESPAADEPFLSAPALHDVAAAAVRQAAAGESPHRLLSSVYEDLLQYEPVPDGGSGAVRLQRTAKARRAHGSFYTPYDLARRVVDEALAPLGDRARVARVLDPAMGTGVFLLGAVTSLAGAGAGDAASLAETRVFGCDVDPVGVEIAILSLWLETGARPAVLSRHLRYHDPLHGSPPFGDEGFNAIVGNPPWGARYPAAVRAGLAARWQAASAGAFDSFKLFLQLAAEQSAGTIGMIVPRAVLVQASHAGIRAFLLDRFAPHAVWTLPAECFPGAVAPACTLFFGPKPGPASVRLVAEEHGDVEEPARRAVPARLWTRDRFPVTSGAMLELLTRLVEIHPPLRNLEGLYRVRDTGINYNRAAVAERVLYDAPYPEHPLDLPRYRGRNFGRYRAIERGGWLRHDAEDRLLPGERLSVDRATYLLPHKVVFRQTADRIVATLDETRMVMGRSVIAIVGVRDASLLALLGCLNSRLLTVLYGALAGEEGRILPQVKVGTVTALPLPRACLDERQGGPWEQLGEGARALLACEGQDRELDAAMDRLVYELYGLSTGEIAAVERCAGGRF